MSKVLITGGTGMIGSRLATLLSEAGHEVVILTRSTAISGDIKSFDWNPEKDEIDDAALEGVNSIIHLAGAGIMDEKWTDQRKQVILNSRTKSAELLLDRCQKLNIKLKNFISASAVGWYPLIIDNKMYDETAAPGSGFLAEVCQKWEASADGFKAVSKHVAKLRIGLVLTSEKGALSQISKPIKLYAGAGLGSGKQIMSWIHIEDVCRMFQHVLERNLDGVYNAVGPEQTTNQDFMQTVADVIDRPIILPNIPEFIIRLLFGPSAEMVLKGVPLSSKKIADTGFSFDHPTVNSALFSIYWKSGSSAN